MDKPLAPLEELTKRPCVFIIRLRDPQTTMMGLFKYLHSRNIHVENMAQSMVNGSEAMVILYCQVEKNGVRHMQYSLEKLKGVIELELLESKSNSVIRKLYNIHPG